ncbi:MAG TPA: ABC transporter permease [Chryseolinea sp.]|nr:ABC transporter permease [Chryseolinea sp.]
MNDNTKRPPRRATKLLQAFVRHDLIEEIIGDLEEKFNIQAKRQSLAGARLNYWYQVFNYLRPFAFRKKNFSSPNQSDMFRNYFKVGFRNLNKNKGYSFINIGGLAMGMAVAMTIGLWIHDELSYDQYHDNYHDIAQVLQHVTFNGERGTGNAVPRPFENALRTGYGADFKYMSMSSWTGEHILSAGARFVGKIGNYYQEDFPEMLSLKMISGTRKGLHDPSSILLSQSTAKALFGDQDPMDQSLQIDNKYDVKVIGVYKDLPHNTTFHELDFMASWELYITDDWVKGALTEWGDNSFQMYVQVNPGGDMKAVSDKIKKVKFNAVKEDKKFDTELVLLPMSDWYLRREFKDGKQTGGRIQMVWMFGLIGGFVLLLACINFMNLSTARSEKRAKEVGIRMAIGSVRSQLINQFLSESFLVVVFAFVVAMGLVMLSLPWFNELADKRISITWLNPWFWLASTGFVALTTLTAGSYPALYLSSFQPVKVLKGIFKAGRFSSLPRKVLVVIQFTVSVTLIVGTVIVSRQIQFAKDRPIGYDRNGLIMISMKSPDFQGKFDVLRNELKNTGAVLEMSESQSPLTDVWNNNGGFDWKGRDPELTPGFATIKTTHEYGKTINWVIKEGRDFSRDHSTDSSAIILNEAAVKFMNVKDPVGMEVTWGPDKLHVIGVVKDVLIQSPYFPVRQAIYLLSYKSANWINLKLNPDKSADESIALVESVFKKLIPNAPFAYKFVDQEFARKFTSEVRIGKLASIFAVLAVAISCLGLFGLASFVAEQRTKEIGIRKILGASVGNLWRMLSKDFVILVIVACLVATPIAWYLFSNWLSQYEYRTEISWWIFAVAAGGALLITLATVSYQAIRAAIGNPVNNLRIE